MIHFSKKTNAFRVKSSLARVWAFVFAVCIFTVSGCALMPKRPEVELPNHIPPQWASGATVDELPVSAGLLDLIREKQVEELVCEALENNPNLAATALRLKASRYLLKTPFSNLLPKASLEFSKGRINNELDLETGERKTENSHQLSLGVNWEIDIWGRLADEYAASENAVLADAYVYLRAKDALAARVIQTWLEQVAIRRSLLIAEERVAVLRHVETSLMERYKNGIGGLDELSTAKSRTQIAIADVSVLKADLSGAVRNLEVLLGRYPGGDLTQSVDLPVIAHPPVGLPAAVLLNRPDIQAGLVKVESERDLASSADKAILPQFRLSGQVFRQSALLGDMGGATSYWDILGSLFQPLFEGGRIRSEAKARHAEADASLMELHAIVLEALKEVEQAFQREHELAAQAVAIKAAAEESEKSSRYYEQRYRQGLDTIQSLLIAREQEMSVKIRLNQVRAERLSNRIDLALALGVGVDSGSEQLDSVHP